MEDLQARYPYLFAGENIGHKFPAGWRGILERLYATIDAELSPDEKARVWIVQQKEKFGGLRVYLSCAPMRVDLIDTDEVLSGYMPGVEPDDLHRRLAPLVRSAEAESLRTCIRCGAPGQARSVRGWRLTLCDDHREG
jgi:hypothetical protein